jgi:Flp pilus assembly pilin Flp
MPQRELNRRTTAPRRAGAKLRIVPRMFTRFHADEGGQGLVEYALIAATIATGVMVAIFFLYNQIAQLFEFITDAVDALMGS